MRNKWLKAHIAQIAGFLALLVAVQQVSAASTTLRWTAPGDNGTIGRATRYDLRYSATPLTEATWGTASVVAGLPVPGVPGFAESMTVTGLDSLTTYYFGLKSADKFSNWSPLSNVKTWRAGRYLVVTPSALNFGATEGSVGSFAGILNLTSSDGVSLTFTSTEGSDWFSLTNPDGATPGTVTVVADFTGRAVGTYTDSIRVVASTALNSPVWVRVTLTISPPVPIALAVTPDTVKFQRIAADPAPAARPFFVSETGGRNVGFSCATNASWMTLSKASGTTRDSVLVSIDVAALSPDSAYIDSVQVVSGVAVNSPRWVMVKVSTEISASTRSLVVAPDSLHFSSTQGFANPPAQSIDVHEASGAGISVSFSSTASWIVLASPDGTTPTSMSVGISASSLGVGQYTDSVQVSSSAALNSPVWVRVSLNIQPQPNRLLIDPDTLRFTAVEGMGNPSPAFITVTETHDRAINFTCGTGGGWIVLRDTNGTTPASIAVDIHASGLESGDYLDSVQFESGGSVNSPTWIRVNLHVEPPPNLIFSDMTISEVTTSSAVIGWRTSRPARSQVLFGPSELYGYSTFMTATMSLEHSAVISDLAPGTLYHIQLVSDPGTGPQLSRDSTFMTSDMLRASGEPVYNVSQPTLIVENIILPSGSSSGTRSGNGLNQYFFMVARDSAMSDVVAVSPAIDEEASAKTSWKIPQPLEPQQRYYWQASVNNVIYTEIQSFVVTGDVHAYPNPFRPLESPSATFTGVPSGSNLLIVTVTGEQIKRWTNNSGQDILWDGRNEIGAPVASGTYLWYVENSEIKGKLIVIR